MPNDHYVTKALTKPWADEAGLLWYFEFSSGQLLSAPNDVLFAGRDLNDADVEARLNQLIESPLTRHRAKLLSGKASTNGNVSSDVHRAMALVFMVQPLRPPIANAGHQLHELLRWPQEELDVFAQVAMKDRRLLSLQTLPGESVLYPSTGMYAVPVQDPPVPRPKEEVIGFALPLTPEHVLLNVPASADVNWMAANRRMLAFLSVSLEPCDRVVVPASLRTDYSDVELANMFVDARAVGRKYFASLLDLQVE